MQTITLDVRYYPFTCDPFEDYEGLRVVSFNRRHRAFKNPEGVGFQGVNKYGELQWDGIMTRRINAGTVYVLSYHEHGRCIWGLPGDVPRCEWDTAPLAGLLILPCIKQMRKEWWWPQVKDVQSRTRFVRERLKEYTAWSNGDVYEIAVATHDCEFDEYDADYGPLIGVEQAQVTYDSICMDYPANENKIEVIGEASYIINERKETAHV